MYLSGLRGEEEEKKTLNIKTDYSVIQINHSIKITVLRDVKACSLENKYPCVTTTCCLHLQDDKNTVKVRQEVLRSTIKSITEM
jgi:hypothetical protein